MDPILLWPDPPPPDLVRVLDLAGLPWVAVADEAAAAGLTYPVAVVSLEDDVEGGFSTAQSLRRGDLQAAPVLLLIRGTTLPDLDSRHSCFDDFCVVPAHPAELEARVRHLIASDPLHAPAPELVQYDTLVLNLETYQASIDGQPLDLTYMEYELLKFLASSPGRVFTREVLLSRVWGYEYYGGARTVDVHIRRLRAKLGEVHAGLIQTVRSVGYKFGEARWG
jgi:DNA-binding response OmpR family regulator